MAADMKANEVLEFGVIGMSNNQRVVNIMHLVTSSTLGDPPGDLSLVNVAMRSRWRAEILPLLADSYWVEQYTIKEVASVTSPTTVTYGDTHALGWTSSDVGSSAGNPLPLHSPATIQVRSAEVGRRKRGSKRLSPITEDMTLASNGNELTETARDDILSAFTALLVPSLSLLTEVFPCIFSTRAAFGTTVHFGAIGVDHILVNWMLGTQLSRKHRTGV